jgi:hypothetical protein
MRLGTWYNGRCLISDFVISDLSTFKLLSISIIRIGVESRQYLLCALCVKL